MIRPIRNSYLQLLRFAVFSEINLLKRSPFKFQKCRLCAFRCPESIQRNFTLYLIGIMLPSASTADNEMGFITLLLFQTR